MRGSGLLLFFFFATLGSTRAQCNLDELECCVSEFSKLVTPSRLQLSEVRVAGACTMREKWEECLEVFLDQCAKNETDKNAVEDIVNKTIVFMREICPPTSDFVSKLKDSEECILNSSMSFETCYNKTIVTRSTNTSDERLKKDCCEYKELRDCAVQVVENKCGPTASQLVHEEVMHMNGIVLEWVCSDKFSQCGNSAVMLASSVLFAFCSVIFLMFLL